MCLSTESVDIKNLCFSRNLSFQNSPRGSINPWLAFATVVVVEITPHVRLLRWVLGKPLVAFGATFFPKPALPRTCVIQLRLCLIQRFWMYDQNS